MDDQRLPVLPPDRVDDSAERYLTSLRSANTRDRHQRQLRRLASIVCRMPVLVRPKRVGQPALPLRLGAVPWRSLQPQHAALARDAALASCPTLRAASALLQPLRGLLRIALADDPGRLFLCLETLRVEGVSAELREQTFWFEHEPDETDSSVAQGGAITGRSEDALNAIGGT